MPNDPRTILSEQRDCLSNEEIRLYLEGDPEVQRTVEKHLVDCEFCNEAMEGFAVVPAFGAVADINAKVKARAAKAAGPQWGLTAGIIGAAVIVAGIFLFSGSLYTMTLTGIRALGAITPLGGLAFIAGWLVLASDAAHYYENVFARKPFPIVVDLQNMLDGFDRLHTLASKRELIVPGHDPLVTRVYPQGVSDHIWRLDHGPTAPLPE